MQKLTLLRSYTFRRWNPLAAEHDQLRFWVCALLALAAIWGHHYPAGIDLPQHANMFRVWVDYYHAKTRGLYEYRQLYETHLLTPYLLVYLFGFILTQLTNALVAVKVLLSFCAIATPLLLTRWLRAIHGVPALGLLGFVFAFGFTYQWGFLSNLCSVPLLLAYLCTYERLVERHCRVSDMLLAGTLAVLLLFTHGITFCVGVSITGLRILGSGSWRECMQRGLHLVPSGLLACYWYYSNIATGAGGTAEWFVTADRALTLFSGLFSAFPDRHWALAGAAMMALLACFTTLAWPTTPARALPFAIAATGFALLPEWLAGTWLVGTRFCSYVHLFAPALLDARSPAQAQRLAGASFLLVVTFLIITNLRLSVFNDEMAGLESLRSMIEPGSDVREMMTRTDADSAAFGHWHLSQTTAWITALQGGILENDSGMYYQLPIRRQPNALFPTEYRYFLARGDVARVEQEGKVLPTTPHLVSRSGRWLLLETPVMGSPVFRVLSTAQQWGKLQLDRSVTGEPLRIAGQSYASGLGTHAASRIRIRLQGNARLFKGACGMDDNVHTTASARFRIRGVNGELLFDSRPMRTGQSAMSFTIDTGSQRELLLEVIDTGSIDSAHANWVDLRLE